jgi:hypothetical protein
MLIIGLLFAATSIAQDYRGTVRGLVTDPSNASVSGAKITLKNVNTGVENVQQSNGLGEYSFLFVEPGTYSVTGELEGFSKFYEQNIPLEIRGDVTVNITLKPGTVNETVTITAQAAQLQFTTATMEVTVDRRMLTDLPIVNRNPSNLAWLDPAVVNHESVTSGLAPFFQWAQTKMDVGGSNTQTNDEMLDGMPLQYSWKGGYMPPMDLIQEFSVQQNSVDAEFGHSAGGVFNFSTRAGTNELHGVAYYYGRNPALNAVSDSFTHSPNAVRNHIVGGVASGAIRKDKLFTSAGFELWRNVTPYTQFETLPTALERTGDFSKSLNAAGGQLTIYDPWSTQFNPTTAVVTRTPFAGNIIPNDRQDPTALRFMKDIWQPNNPGANIQGANNYNVSYPFRAHYWNFMDRTDWNINPKWKMFGRYSYFRTQDSQNNYANSPAIPWQNGGAMNNLNFGGDVVYMMNSSTVFDFRASYSKMVDDLSPVGAPIPESMLEQFWPGNAWYTTYAKNIPEIYYPYLTIGTSAFGKGQLYWQHPWDYAFNGSLSTNKGRHYLKIGSEERFRRGLVTRPDLMTFNFTPDITANTFQSPNTALSGSPWATFLLGAIGSDSNAQETPVQYPEFNYYSVYIQDDFRVKPRLTLTLGLRYEYETAPRDPQNEGSRYLDLTVPIPEMHTSPPPIPANVVAMENVPYVYNGAWVFTDSSHRRMWNSSKTSFMPRLGLAFRINDKTALRIGWARFILPPMLTVDSLGSLAPMYSGFSATSTPLPLLQGVPQAVLSNPFPAATNPVIMPLGKTDGAYTNLGGTAAFNTQDLKTEVNDRINVSLQRTWLYGIHTDVTYFMNRGYNWPYIDNLDMSDPSLAYTYKGLTAQSIPNPFYNYMTAATFPGALRNQANVTVGSLLDQYPQYLSITEANMNGIKDLYQALQIKVKREFANGFFFQLAYNYNHDRTTQFFNAPDQYAGRFTYQAGANPSQRMSIAGTYQLPFGKGRRLLSHADPILNGILGGWELSSLFMFNSGDFLRFAQMIATGDPAISNKTWTHWFNTSMFSAPLAYTPRTNPYQYNDLTGPKYWNLDSTLDKIFPIRDRIKLQLRMEVYNLPNCIVPNDPNTTVTSSLFGRVTDQSNQGRAFQYGVRILF